MERIQRRRCRGWRMPADAVYVGRPTRWGNPFPVDQYGRGGAIARYREWITTGTDRLPIGSRGRCLDPVRCRAELPTLRGRDLACSCAPGLPCHADVLIELANGSAGEAF